MRLLLATRNRKKLAELRRILDEATSALAAAGPAAERAAGPAAGLFAGGGVELLGLDDVPAYPETPETGLTFAENALLKAREAAKMTGLPSVADDSGLAVDVLCGMPGIFSARWSGRHGDDTANLELLLAQVADVPDEHMGAAFVCAAALVLPSGVEHVTHGRMPGRLVRTPVGDGGFGYDPIFVAQGHTRTNAELTPEEKDLISHRGMAFRALAALLG
jgi:XTP/dITP diphosphohydrolase